MHDAHKPSGANRHLLVKQGKYAQWAELINYTKMKEMRKRRDFDVVS